MGEGASTAGSATRVAVVGAAGRMGRLVLDCVLDHPSLVLTDAFVRSGSPALGADCATLADRPPCGTPTRTIGHTDADVVIDFSLPAGLAALLDVLDGPALVTGTTGLGPELEARRDAYAERAPVLAAANFSTGVSLLLSLVRTAAAALPHADLEVVEMHHRHKRDAPSGTALALAGAAAAARGVDIAGVVTHGRDGNSEPRPIGQIGIHALRGGDVVGEHTVWLALDGERLQLGHAASDRTTFARGAVRAAAWVAGRAPGRYSMGDVLGLTSS